MPVTFHRASIAPGKELPSRVWLGPCRASRRKPNWAQSRASSVVTSPCPEKPMMAKGQNLLKGLAWSGRGKITRVDVSLDGGVNWKTAELHGPGLSKSLTRFTMPFEWNGEEMKVQSRAMDETGYVQPTIQALQKERGVNSIYHNNSIATWLVKSNGEVENVRLG